ncbi:hypothetical protein AMAG_14824 [Allomyces macrogynus ATCC 38327]|uniref:Uncharacterized protein n=1 Tax=Allomyces macrogynus (strain ATCC 38327) TaxID=578462 RepID=A0A0L0T5N1_ALLM3|nr:hypothetical protein AMAG_14824 [Allomyces macrogynus ATCC 38327]|eukprot:KNE69986.1 hypothetical protein AMAG_14824 [Allomyces macrogynus ATCC 38327]
MSSTICAKSTEPPAAATTLTPPPPTPFERMLDDLIEYIARHLIALKPDQRHTAASLARSSPLLFIPVMTALLRNAMSPFSLTPMPAKDGYSLSTRSNSKEPRSATSCATPSVRLPWSNLTAARQARTVPTR